MIKYKYIAYADDANIIARTKELKAIVRKLEETAKHCGLETNKKTLKYMKMLKGRVGEDRMINSNTRRQYSFKTVERFKILGARIARKNDE